MAEAAARGVTMIVNNRPDGEEPGQPTAPRSRRRPRRRGSTIAHIPIEAAVLAASKVEAMSDGAGRRRGAGCSLFCRSGTRSAYLWALARAREGALPEALAHAMPGSAGYNLRPILPWLKPQRG